MPTTTPPFHPSGALPGPASPSLARKHRVQIVACGKCSNIQLTRRTCLYCGRSLHDGSIIDVFEGNNMEIGKRLKELKAERAKS